MIAAISVDYPGTLLDVRHLVADDLHEVERNLSLVATLGHRLAPGDDGRLAVELPGGDIPAELQRPVRRRASLAPRSRLGRGRSSGHRDAVAALARGRLARCRHRRTQRTRPDRRRRRSTAVPSTSAGARRSPSSPPCSPAPRPSSSATRARRTSPSPSELRSCRCTPRPCPASRWRPWRRAPCAARRPGDRLRRLPRPAVSRRRSPVRRRCHRRSTCCPPCERLAARPGRGAGVNIFLWHVHGSWTTAFVQGEHRYFVPVDRDRSPWGLGRARTWTWPDAAVEVTEAEAAELEVDVVAAATARGAARAGGAVAGRAPARASTCPPCTSSTTRRRAGSTTCVHPDRWPTRRRDGGPRDARSTTCSGTAASARRASSSTASSIPAIATPASCRGSPSSINEPARRGRVTGTDLLSRFAVAAPVDLFGIGARPALGGHREPAAAALHDAMARRRVYVHPVRWTSLGLSLLEAMHLGMPVVALATTEVPDAVPAGAGVVSTSVDVLVDAARRLVADPEEARVMGKAARAAALARYGLARFLGDWDALFEEVTHESDEAAGRPGLRARQPAGGARRRRCRRAERARRRAGRAPGQARAASRRVHTRRDDPDLPAGRRCAPACRVVHVDAGPPSRCPRTSCCRTCRPSPTCCIGTGRQLARTSSTPTSGCPVARHSRPAAPRPARWCRRSTPSASSSGVTGRRATPARRAAGHRERGSCARSTTSSHVHRRGVRARQARWRSHAHVRRPVRRRHRGVHARRPRPNVARLARRLVVVSRLVERKGIGNVDRRARRGPRHRAGDRRRPGTQRGSPTTPRPGACSGSPKRTASPTASSCAVSSDGTSCRRCCARPTPSCACRGTSPSASCRSRRWPALGRWSPVRSAVWSTPSSTA